MKTRTREKSRQNLPAAVSASRLREAGNKKSGAKSQEPESCRLAAQALVEYVVLLGLVSCVLISVLGKYVSDDGRKTAASAMFAPWAALLTQEVEEKIYKTP